MLENRENETYSLAKSYGFTTICGHTPSEDGLIVEAPNMGFIRIDAGCGHKKKESRLALYCIDNGTVQYFEEKETVQGQQTL